MFLLLLVALVWASVPESAEPWQAVMAREMFRGRECLPHEYQALMNDWFVKLEDTAQYRQLYSQALDSMRNALQANKPFCKTLNQALHSTVRRLEYQLSQEQYSAGSRGWFATLEHMKAQRHSLLRQCDDTLYKQQGKEIRQCLESVYIETMQQLAVHQIG